MAMKKPVDHKMQASMLWSAPGYEYLCVVRLCDCGDRAEGGEETS